MATTEQLQAIETQLACPQGPKGLDIANMMHQTNINMTLAGWKALRLNPNARVLELGHGNAAHVTPLLKQRKDVHYTGLEISELMCEQAHGYNKEMVKHYRATFWHYDGQYIPSFIRAFDGIFSVNTLYFWSKPLDLLMQLKQQLAQFGRLSLVYMDADFLHSLPFVAQRFAIYQPQEVEQMLLQVGFEKVRTQTLSDEVTKPDQSSTKRVFYVTTAQL